MRKAVPSIADSEYKRRLLAQRIESDIYAGINARAGLEDVWMRVEHFHRNERPLQQSVASSTLTNIHMPLLQPRLDQLNSQVCSVVAGSLPYMLATSGSDDLSTRIERTIHRHWQTAGFDQQIRKAAIIASDTNRAIWRVAFNLQVDALLPEGDETLQAKMDGSILYSGISIDVIHPRDFVVAPATVEGVQSAQLVGHRFYRSVNYIKERQRIGEYFDDSLPIDGNDPHEHIEKLSKEYVSYQPLDESYTEPVELWDCVVRLAPSEGKRQRYYLATLALNHGVLLRFEEYPFSRPWYFTSGYLTETIDYWGDGKSVGKNLYPLQEAFNNNHSLLYDGAQMSALPPIYGPHVDNEKHSFYGPREYIEIDSDFKLITPEMEFHGEDIRANNADIERIADSVSRSSTNSLGAEEAKNITATQSQQIASGTSIGMAEFIRSFTADFAAMADFTMEVLESYYPLWKPFYPDLNITKDELKTPTMFEVNGKSPADTPMARSIALQQLIQFGKEFPEAQFDMYVLGQVLLSLSGIPGADHIQKERPPLVPAIPESPASPNGPAPSNGANGEPGMASDGPVPSEPQGAGNAGPLTPLAASLARPAANLAPPGAGGAH